jgi:hypothetical protein
MVWLNFIDVSSRTLPLSWHDGTNHKTNEENITFYLDHRMSRSLGLDQVEIHRSTNFYTSKLAIGVSCAHKCITIGNKCNVGTESN